MKQVQSLLCVDFALKRIAEEGCKEQNNLVVEDHFGERLLFVAAGLGVDDFSLHNTSFFCFTPQSSV